MRIQSRESFPEPQALPDRNNSRQQRKQAVTERIQGRGLVRNYPPQTQSHEKEYCSASDADYEKHMIGVLYEWGNGLFFKKINGENQVKKREQKKGDDS